jgi:uncharacterized protein YqhQ
MVISQKEGNSEHTPQPVDRKALGTELAMGGQAVIEGVMMRSPQAVAVAVRQPDGTIATHRYPFVSRAKRIPFWKPPILRGIISIYESLTIGLKALTWSAEMADGTKGEETSSPSFWDKAGVGAMLVMALVLGLVLFMGVPYVISQWMQQGSTNQFRFHLVAGAIRILIFLLYIWGISRIKDIGRVFQYHGAEHKSIFAFEQGKELEVGAIKPQSRFHPRCGTSFLLITLIAVLVVYAVIDSLVVLFFGNYPNAFLRLLVHLPLIPLVLGISFEVLKASGRHFGKPMIQALVQPGLWLQRMTTREPDDSQIEVALTALKAAMEDN